jgi:hypothetical protein
MTIRTTILNARPLFRTLGAGAMAWCLAIASAAAENFCVAPGGDDANPGTKELPFATVGRAQRAMAPGDTTWLRGGTYRLTEASIMSRDRFLAAIFLLGKSGTKEKPIRYFAYPGERPVFDCSEVKPAGLRISAFRVFGSWIHLKGIEVTGVQVTATGHTQSICFENHGSHNIYENLSMHDGQAIGLYITRGSDNLVLNCDAYRNHDSTSEGGRGGNTDGFGCHVPRGGGRNVFKGCRAWLNSDDGFDCISDTGGVAFINCWAFLNGYGTDMKPRGDGNGFKAGGYGVDPGTRFPDPVPRHRVVQCVAVRNRAAGFYANHHPGGIDWIHNSAYRNSVNYNFLGRSLDATTDVPGFGHVIMNNLSFGSTREVRHLDAAACKLAGNTWERRDKPTEKDFLSLDEELLTAPRRADGGLSETPFLRLTKDNPWNGTCKPADAAARRDPTDPGAFVAK